MKNNLLSIGEVARMKGVSVKALRYYERIGILPPAQVSERTGYRFYTMSQMPEVDIIQSCIELGIPLKELAGYRTERGTLDLSALLAQGFGLASEKLRRAQGTMAQIESYCKGIEVQQTYRHTGTHCVRSVEQCTVLAREWGDASFDAKRYVSVMTKLYHDAGRLSLTPLYLQGMARFASRDGGSSVWYAVLQVCAVGKTGESAKTDDEGAATMVVPGGVYQVERVEHEGFEQCFEQAFEKAATWCSAGKPLLALDVWDAEIGPGQSVVELLRG